jgi:hypothetical protein
VLKLEKKPGVNRRQLLADRINTQELKEIYAVMKEEQVQREKEEAEKKLASEIEALRVRLGKVSLTKAEYDHY